MRRSFFIILIVLLTCESGARAERQRLGDLPEKDPNSKNNKTKENDLTPEEKQRMMSGVIDTFYQKGKQAMADGRLEQAEAFFDRVLILQPNHAGARRNLRRIFQIIDEQSPVKKAKDRKVSELGNLEAELKQLIAKENWDKAGRTARRILAIDAKNTLAQTSLEKINQVMFSRALEKARQKEKAEDWESAIDAYQLALGYKMDPAIRNKIAALREKIRARNDKASEDFYLKALLASQEGNVATALELCQKALELNPKNVQAQRMMDRLKSKAGS